jgi:hypothetical protein
LSVLQARYSEVLFKAVACIKHPYSRHSRWPCRLRRRSAGARLLGSRVRIPLRAWMCRVSCVCCVQCR